MYLVVSGFAETDVTGRIAAGAEDGAEENGAVAKAGGGGQTDVEGADFVEGTDKTGDLLTGKDQVN